MTLFSDLNLSEPVLRALADMGFSAPTDIQARAIPVILQGQDVIGKSHTGTGKTVAFGVPSVLHTVPGGKTQVLILCPTRELAMQAEGELRKICKYIEGVRVLAVYGGDPITTQIRQLSRGAQIVVGTPGRVMDLMRRHALRLEDLRVAVLDEADEMLSMGFREDIETILQASPEARQTVLFSATMPPEILEITGEYQRDPVLIEAGNTAERTMDTIQQYYFEVPRGEKERALTLLLHAQQPRLSIVFCNTKKMVDELGRYLGEHGFQASALHGDMKQDMRTSVMNSFKSGRTPILIATDVAARGIDVDDVDAVYNFDIPQDFEYYIHRIGRTGRAGRTGASYTLIDGPRQAAVIRSIERFTRAKIARMPLPDYEAIAGQRSQAIGQSIRAAMLEQANGEDSRFSAQSLLCALLDEGFSPEQVAEAALSQLIAREMACIPEVRAPKRAQPKPLAALREGCVRLRVSVGRNQKVAPNHIVAAIAECTGISGKRIGKIQCYGDYSLAEVPEELANRIVHEVSGMPIGGIPADLRIYREGGASSHNRHDRPHRGTRHGDTRSRSHSKPGRRRK
ncbi:MAG: DEAD/DEAH box helicase [Butyricicoccus sp.]|nr:DEAD/DEAH box helicase [Butyricicoccus sp.]